MKRVLEWAAGAVVTAWVLTLLIATAVAAWKDLVL